jgi:hypothetical protein
MYRYLLNLCFLALLGGPLALSAQYPDTLHLAELRSWLKAEYYDSDFSNLGYSEARRQMFSYTDENGGVIQCVYSDFTQTAEYSTFPNPMNTEHLVPQSFFGSAEPMRSDIHVLRPTHQSANSSRANWPFGEVPDMDARWYGLDQFGDYIATFDEPSPNVDFSESLIGLWEPQEDRKGDIARQIFYFYTMYPTQAGPIDSLADSELLYQWHIQDPADALELQRNDRVELAQGNRNPYIDYADLVYDAWFWEEEDCSAFESAPVDLTKSFQPVPYPNGVIDRVQVKWYKASPQVKYSPEDNAACDIQFWPIRDLLTNTPINDPDTSLIPDRTKPGQEFFKWPIKFQRADVQPNIRYRWRVRCACEEGAGLESPWSESRIFNTPDYDPVTNIYTPPGGIIGQGQVKSLSLSDNQVQLVVMPNPSDGMVTLLTETTGEYLLRDMTGRVLDKFRLIAGERYPQDLTELDSGVYLIQDATGNDTQRLIIK